MRNYGLILSRELLHGCEYVSAKVVSSENGKYPMNCKSDGESHFCEETPKVHCGLQYCDLGMVGHVSDYDQAYCAFEAEYRAPHSVTLPAAERMVKTLRRIQREVKKAQAQDPGDYLMALAHALHLDFVAVERGKRRGSMYSDSDWTFMTIEEGRNFFRRMIDEACTEARARKKPAA